MNVDQATLGTVIWADLQTPDLDAARKFYGGLFGWTFEGGDDANMGFYTTALLGGRKVAGMAKMGGSSPVPPMWSIYFGVSDARDFVTRASAAGAKVVAGAMDIHELGSMAYFADPSGAHFGVWQPKQHYGAQVFDDAGAMCWHEVYSKELPKALPFYTELFALTAKKLDAPGIDYNTLHQGARTVCGAMQMPSHFPANLPSHWNTYFSVDDPDAAVKKVAELGGKVISPAFDTPFGRMAMFADPFGATFCVIKPSRPSTR